MARRIVSGKALLIIGEPVFVYLLDSLLGLMAKSDSQFNADTFNEQEQMLICGQRRSLRYHEIFGAAFDVHRRCPVRWVK